MNLLQNLLYNPLLPKVTTTWNCPRFLYNFVSEDHIVSHYKSLNIVVLELKLHFKIKLQYKQLPREQQIFSKSNIYTIKVSKINITFEKFFLIHDCAIYITYIVYIYIDIFFITDLSLRRISIFR